jgi:hypothetical protein
MNAYRYRPLLRPASCGTLPAGVHWQYVEAPAIGGLINWFALPQSRSPSGSSAPIVNLRSRRSNASEAD